ncbi:MAG: AGE family epimerase/isomerase [Bacteroidales bacterium]|nr:AGE family epimerase/isomerase [Bacteroidales bacterium]MBO5472139.1 AGE family epimerase/isomerase [Bacteroidales bacterium]
MTRPQKTAAELFAAQALASQVKKELTENILPYWTSKMCNPAGGFYGRISGNEETDLSAPVGNIMTARLLWTYSSAYRLFKDSAEAEGYLAMATRAKDLIISRFYDPEYGGTYWSLNPDGTPLDTKKQIYAIAFTIYGLAELNRATGDAKALEYAIKLFNSIEDHSFDTEKDGYFEAFTRTWDTIEDMRLSDKDANESKTMNTHLHVLEAYTCLYRVWKNSRLEERLRGLIGIFEKHILGPDGHLRLFFDDDWNSGYDIVSYGHDIEASWLIHEAALVLGDEAVIGRIEKLVPAIAAAAGEGFSPEGGMIYEKNAEETDRDRHWWVQAETVVGYLNLWDHFGTQEGLENALTCWDFIKANLIDRENGEWFWSLREDGTVNRDDDKAGFWKCPYHNGRMCMEIIERVNH